MIYGMIEKILQLSHPKFYQKDMKNMIVVLLKNSYTISFIFYIIYTKIKYYCNETISQKRNASKFPPSFLFAQRFRYLFRYFYIL